MITQQNLRSRAVMDPQALSGDQRTLAADLYTFHDRVVPRLLRADPDCDHERVHDAFVLTVMEISQKYYKYKPAEGSVEDFLVGASRRKLRDLVRSDQARCRREKKKGKNLVADQQAATRELLDILADAEMADKIRKEIATTEEERIVLRLWELGVEDADEYARELGIENRTREEVQERVKTIRDRITVRMRRIRKSLPDEEIAP